MLSISSKWEQGFVYYIAKFTILRFVISRFECTYIVANWVQISRDLFKTLSNFFFAIDLCP